MTPELERPSHWVCMKCKKPVRGSGVITISNANTDLGRVGAYPIEKSPDSPPWENEPEYVALREGGLSNVAEQQEALSRDVRWLINRPTNIQFAVYHFACRPAEHESAYDIPATESATAWMAWIAHVHEKTWMGKWDLHRMLTFWWTHKGERVPPP